jgi:hypothetical protein
VFRDCILLGVWIHASDLRRRGDGLSSVSKPPLIQLENCGGVVLVEMRDGDNSVERDAFMKWLESKHPKVDFYRADELLKCLKGSSDLEEAQNPLSVRDLFREAQASDRTSKPSVLGHFLGSLQRYDGGSATDTLKQMLGQQKRRERSGS